MKVERAKWAGQVKRRGLSIVRDDGEWLRSLTAFEMTG